MPAKPKLPSQPKLLEQCLAAVIDPEGTMSVLIDHLKKYSEEKKRKKKKNLSEDLKHESCTAILLTD